MKSIIDMTRINKAYPFVGRAALRSMTGTLNFTIANLCASDIRAKTLAVPVGPANLEPLLAKYGNTLDRRNEQDEASRGAAHEEQLREEQGFDTGMAPLEMAGRLKVIRDALAEDLMDNAVMLRNPLDPKGTPYADPYSIATPLEESFRKQLTMVPKVNEAQVEAMCKALAIPTITVDDVRRVLLAQQEAGVKFLKAHGDDILAYLGSLTATGGDGHLLSTADAVDVEMALPPIRRAALFVAADRGLWYERDRQIKLILRGHPDGAGNIKFVDGARTDIHAEFNRLMKHDPFRQGIDEAVQRGSRWPVLLDLPVATPMSASKAA